MQTYSGCLSSEITVSEVLFHNKYTQYSVKCIAMAVLVHIHHHNSTSCVGLLYKKYRESIIEKCCNLCILTKHVQGGRNYMGRYYTTGIFNLKLPVKHKNEHITVRIQLLLLCNSRQNYTAVMPLFRDTHNQIRLPTPNTETLFFKNAM
jgi:hypothetical protein